jgi:hypothetical protein
VAGVRSAKEQGLAAWLISRAVPFNSSYGSAVKACVIGIWGREGRKSDANCDLNKDTIWR